MDEFGIWPHTRLKRNAQSTKSVQRPNCINKRLLQQRSLDVISGTFVRGAGESGLRRALSRLNCALQSVVAKRYIDINPSQRICKRCGTEFWRGTATSCGPCSKQFIRLVCEWCSKRLRLGDGWSAWGDRLLGTKSIQFSSIKPFASRKSLTTGSNHRFCGLWAWHARARRQDHANRKRLR